jgi:hypothetical protein
MFADPIDVPVPIVMAESAATAFARELVKVTEVMDVHEDPDVRVKPVVVGRLKVVPLTPLSVILVVMLVDAVKPFAVNVPTVWLALTFIRKSAGPLNVGERATTPIEVRFSTVALPARSVGATAAEDSAWSKVQR